MSKCDTCSNDAEYVFTECEDEKHFCEKCAISHFSLYPMQHCKCNHCGKPCVEGAYEEDGYWHFCSAKCAIQFCIDLYGDDGHEENKHGSDSLQDAETNTH